MVSRWSPKPITSCGWLPKPITSWRPSLTDNFLILSFQFVFLWFGSLWLSRDVNLKYLVKTSYWEHTALRFKAVYAFSNVEQWTWMPIGSIRYNPVKICPSCALPICVKWSIWYMSNIFLNYYESPSMSALAHVLLTVTWPWARRIHLPGPISKSKEFAWVLGPGLLGPFIWAKSIWAPAHGHQFIFHHKCQHLIMKFSGGVGYIGDISECIYIYIYVCTG